MLTSCDVGLFGGLPSAAMALQLHRRAHGMLLRLFARIRYAADDGLVGEGYDNTNQVKKLRQPLALLCEHEKAARARGGSRWSRWRRSRGPAAGAVSALLSGTITASPAWSVVPW
jgi:hypothetical protein